MWTGAALTAALAISAYANALNGPFVYDDRATIVENPSLRDPSNLRFVLLFSLFRPFVNASYALDYAVWGLRPFGYHLTSLVLHACAAVAWHRLVWRVTEDRNARHAPLPPAAVALGAGSLWAVHPLLTQAVAYVSGRSELLGSLWLIVAFLAFRRGVLANDRVAYGAGVLAFLLSVGSKETAAVLPLVLLVWDRLFVDRQRFRRRALRVYLPILVVVAAAAAVRLATLVAAEAALARGTWENVLIQARVVWRYAALVFVPYGQALMHDVSPGSGSADALSLAALLMLGVCVVLAWRVRKAEPLVPFSVVWFLLILLPSSSVIALKEPMAEHRAYLASAGLVLLAVVAAVRWWPRGRATARRWASVAILAVLLVLTWSRNGVWSDPVRLWTEAVRAAPSQWEAHYALADTLREQRRCEEAIGGYQAALQIAPSHRDALNNLGICLAQVGRHSDAQAALEAALEVDPRFARAHVNLGNLALVRGDAAAARAHFERALSVDFANLTARRQLVALAEAAGDFGRAAAYCRTFLAGEGDNTEWVTCVQRNEARASGGR